MTPAATATVIDFPKPRKRGRPSKADDHRIEMDSRTVEERRFARDAEPLLRRLEFGAVELGPAWMATVQHLAYLHERHARRWTSQGDPGDAA